MITATALGFAQAEELISRLEDGIKGAGSDSVSIQTAVVYAWGMEFGYYRNGKLARKAGGAFMLTGALDAVKPSYLAALPLALFIGRGAVQQALLKAAADIQARAATNAPRLTGTLSNSFQIDPSF